MYRMPWDISGETASARGLLAAPARLEHAMRAVIDAWPRSAAHHLSNMEENRRAWLGQAACRHSVNATAYATRAAWPQLTDEQRAAANGVAERVIRVWEEDNADEPTLFG
jgi:hypothetical protein